MLKEFTPGGVVYCFLKSARGQLIALLILVGIAQFPLIMSPDRFSFAGDVDWTLGYLEMVRRSVLEFFEFPFWGAWNHGGVPLFANPQITIFGLEFPCLLLFGTWYGWRVAIYLYMLFGTAGMFLFLRCCAASPVARFWGAAIFGMSSCIALHSMVGHPGMTCITFLPWLLYFEQRINRNSSAAVMLGVMTGLMFNQSLHYLTLINCVVMALLGISLARRHWRERNFRLRVLLSICIAAVLSGYRVVATLDYLASFPREMEELLSIPVGKLIAGLVQPFVPITTPVVQSGRLGLQWHEIGSYVGVLAVGFFLISMIRALRWYHWGALVTVVLILDSTSRFLPGYWLRQIPPFTSFFVITRWRFLLVFFLAAGAAGGLAWCLRNFPKYRKVFLAVPVISCIAMGANLWHVYCGNGEWMSERALLDSHRQIVAPSGLVTILDPAISYYISTRKNLDNLIGYEAVQGYFHDSRFACLPIGHPNYRGEFYSQNGSAELTAWSPNRIDFQTAVPGRIRINQNPGNYWRNERGELLFPDYREFEEDKPFLVDVPAGRGYFYALPRLHEAGLTLMFVAAGIALLCLHLLRPADQRRRSK